MKVAFVVRKGGPGSGFRGHRGRPGKVGGALPEGETPDPRTASFVVDEPKTKSDYVRDGKVRLAKDFSDLAKVAGDNITIECDFDDPTVQLHLNDLDKIPHEFMRAMVKDKVTWVISNTTYPNMDKLQRLKGVTPRGWRPTSTWDDVAGGYDTDLKQVALGKGQEWCASLALHETGHAFYYEFMRHNPGIRFPLERKQRSIRDTLPRYFQQEGEAGLDELCAESFAVAYVGRMWYPQGLGDMEWRTLFLDKLYEAAK